MNYNNRISAQAGQVSVEYVLVILLVLAGLVGVTWQWQGDKQTSPVYGIYHKIKMQDLILKLP